VHFVGAELGSPRPSPLLGQHTDEILHDLLGHDAAAIAALHRAGIV
jgi:crotonobetainyl-CoA:carnitine CoA-transferase CaiB-like acyl-CoA transferase